MLPHDAFSENDRTPGEHSPLDLLSRLLISQRPDSRSPLAVCKNYTLPAFQSVLRSEINLRSAGNVTAICLKEYFKWTGYAHNIIIQDIKASCLPTVPFESVFAFPYPISHIIDHASALRPRRCRCLQFGIIAAYQ
ncbi:hypothetical protein CY34DRAFT_693148 [Suillus luteus UH-Slu-Lm8-n1]|uniref:Uncharacterized protein n=1 Tax=Suillus luteus UH-Slu-Lm8-n1 TaxID=930992 RepID=A0A0D0A146_9AGAM|nr:hypothetical protein CY34DRAFT_693148 [Suillus luteus UH-Slu-Lm8-n1]